MSLGSTLARLIQWDVSRRRAPSVYRAPADMTEHGRIRELVRWGEAALESGHREIVVDLSKSQALDSSLLAGLVLLARRVKPHKAKLRIVGSSERFESLMRLYRLFTALEQSGVEFE